MDDAAYLAIVQWIPLHPLHPLSGWLNWGDSVQPFSTLNQPVLYIYLGVVVWALFGPSLLAQHALMAAASSAVVLVFYRLAQATGCQHPLWLTALLVLLPIFGLTLLWRRQGRQLWLLVIPLAVLGGWSAF